LYGKKHIDLHKIYSKEIIQKGVFNDKYRSLHLEEVSQALLGIGKYSDSNNNSISGDRSHLLSVEEQISYVGRDSELTMMLACYNDCLVLRIMEFIAMYSEMDYVITCHTGVTKWYTNIYNKMIERDECTLQTSEHKISKQDYGGGNSIEPIKGFYKNEPIDELDVKGMYPTIAIKYNISFETVNCRCCKDNPSARIPVEVMNEINIRLQEKALPCRTENYWICKLRTGSFPKVLTKLLKEREKCQSLLKQELTKSKQQQELINYYEARQVAVKLLANAGYGVFARKEFEYSDFRVSEIITGFGRLTHKKMQELGFQYEFQTVFGFTDSIFVRHNKTTETSNLTSSEAGSKIDKTEQNINQYLDDCHNELGVISLRFWNLAYCPFVVLFAPIPISIASIEFSEKRIAIDLSCARHTDIQRLELVIFGSDERGTGTFRERLTKFTRYRNTERVRISEIKPDDKSIYLTLRLSYKGELIEDRTIKRQEIVFGEIPKEIQETKRKIYEKYMNAKHQSNSNKKGVLFEQVVEEIVNLVPDLKVVESNINNGIEEIDLMVRNHNRKRVWADFDGLFFIECKNWSERVGSDDVGNFALKLQNNNINTGILIAIKGITGRGLTEGARGQIKTQLIKKNMKIIVLDGDDLEDIFRCRDVSDKIDEKYIELYKIRH
jgi:hypothetical protein